MTGRPRSTELRVSFEDRYDWVLVQLEQVVQAVRKIALALTDAEAPALDDRPDADS